MAVVWDSILFAHRDAIAVEVAPAHPMAAVRKAEILMRHEQPRESPLEYSSMKAVFGRNRLWASASVHLGDGTRSAEH